jgi:cytochrome P450
MNEITFSIGKSTAPLPPKLPGAPVLGNALSLLNRPEQFLAKSYESYGPVYQIAILGKPIFVLAGKEANRFAQRNGGTVFSHEDLFSDLAVELGSNRNMIAIEGELHALYRKTAKGGYSRNAIMRDMDVVFRDVDAFIEAKGIGDKFEVFPAMQQLISIQLGKMALNYDVSDNIHVLQDFMRRLLYIEVSKIWPKWFKRLPGYRKSHQSTLDLANMIVEWHLKHPPGKNRDRDIVDDFLEGHNQYPDKISMADVRSAALGPILAGQDTVAGTTAYMLYAVCKNDSIYDKVQAEVDSLFGKGEINPADLRAAKTLHEVAIETMRVFPVAPFVPQITVKEFEFAGYRIPEGAMVYLAQSVIHFLEENFEAPFEFRIDRGRPTKPSEISPFGLGPHVCIGAGMGEAQIMLNVARLLYRADFSIYPMNYEIKSKALPPSPKDFRLKIVGKRNR